MKQIMRLGLVILIAGIMTVGYGGLCKKKKPNSSVSSGSSGASYDGNTGDDPGAIGNPTFTLVWNFSGSTSPEGPDIDIWVTCPNGHKLTTSPESNTYGPYGPNGVITPEGGQIDYDDQGGWGPGDGGGAERAYWPTGQAPVGIYTYGLRYFRGDGTVTYTMRSFVNGVTIDAKVGSLTSPGSAITVGSTSNY